MGARFQSYVAATRDVHSRHDSQHVIDALSGWHSASFCGDEMSNIGQIGQKISVSVANNRSSHCESAIASRKRRIVSLFVILVGWIPELSTLLRSIQSKPECGAETPALARFLRNSQTRLGLAHLWVFDHSGTYS
jgi:hypothetical protein